MAARVYAIGNEKGGVGKTTYTISIGHEFSSRDKKTLIIDLDPSGDATRKLLGQDLPACISRGDSEEGTSNTFRMFSRDATFTPHQVSDKLYIMGATDVLSKVGGEDMDPAFNFAESVQRIMEEFDVILIDCPPTFGLLFTAATLAAVNGVIVPTFLEDSSFDAVGKVVDRVGRLNNNFRVGAKVLGIAVVKVKQPMIEDAVDVYEKLVQAFAILLFDTMIDETTRIEAASKRGMSVSDYARTMSKSKAKVAIKAAKQITDLTDEIITRTEG